MLDVAKEDVSIKNDLLTQMKSTNKDQFDQLRALNETMVNLTKSINEGMYACMHVCMHACMHRCMRGWMYACMYACMHAFMYRILMFCLYRILMFSETNTFHVALGGDGAPFDKDDSACAWLVSILNIGQGVLSSIENFLLFGVNCSKNCIPVRRFLRKLLADIRKIESTTNQINKKGELIDVRFVISELLNDMKMLSFLGGDLSNSASYFSSFANVTLQSARDLKGTYGQQNFDTWQPWKYTHRVSVAKKVVKLRNH